ncbi:ATP-binding protein [Prauserella muralis]|nr:ATP-binding protein [Prauserella muralis]TWE22289.1 hypothetical protein FHX69_3525 [Prauserella muralis]
MVHEDTDDADGARVVNGRSRSAREFLGDVRTQVRTLLRDWDTDTAIDAVLVADELVSRRVRHGPPPAAVRLALDSASGALVVELDGAGPACSADRCADCAAGARLLDALGVSVRECRAEFRLSRRPRFQATQRVRSGQFGDAGKRVPAPRRQTLPG